MSERENSEDQDAFSCQLKKNQVNEAVWYSQNDEIINNFRFQFVTASVIYQINHDQYQIAVDYSYAALSTNLLRNFN